jgi:hypothetical protein
VTKPKEITLPELSGGLNTRDPEYEINDNQSPDMLNMWYREKALVKRPGQTLYTTLANVYKAWDVFGSYRCIHAGTNLYKWAAGAATKITTSALEDQVQDSAGFFMESGGYLWYFDGVEIWRIDSSYTVTRIAPNVPIVQINTTPAGEGTDNDPYNLIGAGFTVWFNGDAATASYTLPQASLDATTVTCTVGGVAVVENTGFTVNRTTGTVDFSAGTSPHGAPASGTDNVIITAYKTVSGNKAKIAACKYGTPYGGEAAGVFGGTRCFAMGNASYPYYYWRCDLTTGAGITYWPDTSYELLDQNNEAITGVQKMGAYMIIIKENSAFSVGYSFDGENIFYPVNQIFDTTGETVGCDMPGSIQLIDNKLVFAHSKGGVFIMVNYDVENEANIKPLSGNINSLLLKESNLTSAVSADFDQCYWLCAGGYAYVWDYGASPFYNYSDYDKAQRRLAWFRFDNMTPTCMFGDADLYYGSTDGIVSLDATKNDFGEALTAYWKSKAYDLNAPDELKLFQYVYPVFPSIGDIYATLTVMNENTDDYASDDYDIKTFSWDGFTWDTFTWDARKFPEAYKFKANMKKSVYIQFKLEGSTINRGVGLSKIKFTYLQTGKTKKRSA